MEEIGLILELEALKVTPQGVYLITENEQEILLPNKYVPADLEMGDKIEVFVYTDSEDRPIATTLEPKIKLNELAFLKAVDVNNYGAFFDWGVEKDLLVPFSEQFTRIEAGKKYLIYMYKDKLTNRMVGTTKFGKFIRENKVEIEPGEEVDLLVSDETEIGFKVIVNNKHYGMLYKNEIFREIHVGDQLKGYLQRVRADNKMDITLNSANLSEVEVLANRIYERLLKEKGKLNFSDKSAPEIIYSEFQVSKKAFRRAIGLLYSERKITITPESIEMVK
ncbi:MAG: GntR family transcriptional regulator [Flavobacteriales bacterium CG_4_10_14_0_2_um_filter_32_8]|nr:MAG: GntR family transcriptional regulator [Flavobacteriales bacterium CG_4_10_14_0_2_um_filter_32_8]PJB16426.1 MAG: GntR family transcriptional regulator [Flavobacteriales bacterium CG_4_9_14_3_um_filter_32_8]